LDCLFEVANFETGAKQHSLQAKAVKQKYGLYLGDRKSLADG
jgi:PIN domain nuclease of toxin-antitoxin system